MRMPSRRATAQACCPPAPPNTTSAWSRTSWPRAIDTCRIASAMLRVGDREEALGDAPRRARRAVARAARRASAAQRRARRARRRAGTGSDRATSRPSARFDVGEGELARVRVGRSRAGPGRAPALSGPTVKRQPSKRQIEPPPAATVWIAIIGARSAHAGDLASRRRARASPSSHARHVGRRPAHVEADRARDSRPRARRCAQRDHAAGGSRQDRVAAAEARAASVSPPLDCIMRSVLPGSSRAQRGDVVARAAASGRRRRPSCRRARAGPSRRRPRARARRARSPAARASSPISRSSAPSRVARAARRPRGCRCRARAARASVARAARRIGPREHVAVGVARARRPRRTARVAAAPACAMSRANRSGRVWSPIASRSREAARDRQRARRALALEQRVGRERGAHAHVAGRDRRRRRARPSSARIADERRAVATTAP